jgi:hypothetical protein
VAVVAVETAWSACNNPRNEVCDEKVDAVNIYDTGQNKASLYHNYYGW